MRVWAYLFPIGVTLGAGPLHSKESSPVDVLMYAAPQCNGEPLGTATLGKRVYSARQIWKVSNEAELCYSWDGPDAAVRSVQWRCADDGMHVTQTPFSSEDCTGEKLVSGPSANISVGAVSMMYDSSMWSGVLSGDTCLTEDAADESFGYISFRFSKGMDASVRPRCVQSWLAMEHQVAAAIQDKERMTFKLERQKSQLQAVDAAQDQRDKGRYLILGAVAGFIGGAFVSSLFWRCRSGSGKSRSREARAISAPLGDVDGEELSCSMLSGKGDDLEFAALAG